MKCLHISLAQTDYAYACSPLFVGCTDEPCFPVCLGGSECLPGPQSRGTYLHTFQHKSFVEGATWAGVSMCFDLVWLQVYVPALDLAFTVSKETRIFACQNPVAQGGGRKQLPKSFLNRFSRVCAGGSSITSCPLNDGGPLNLHTSLCDTLYYAHLPLASPPLPSPPYTLSLPPLLSPPLPLRYT